MTDLHDGPTGGHFSRDTTAHKILRAGYYWPTLFKDAHAHIRIATSVKGVVEENLKQLDH